VKIAKPRVNDLETIKKALADDVMAFPTTTEAVLSAKVDLFLSIPEPVVFFGNRNRTKGGRILASDSSSPMTLPVFANRTWRWCHDQSRHCRAVAESA
jgi:hypothetical protein